MVKKVLFIGLGSIGLRHLQNLITINPDLDVGALRSGQGNNIKSCEFVDFEFNNISDAKEFEPEIVFITNPTSLHIDMALEFVNKVSGIFIEKPISDNIEDAQKLVDNAKNGIIHVACPLRFHPVINFVKKYIEDENDVLNVRIFSGSYLPSWRPNIDYRACYSAKMELGGGVSLDLIHEVDFLRWIFGDIKEGYFSSSKVSDLDIEVEDFAHALLKLETGAICELHLDYFRKIPKRELEITTKDGVIFADILNSEVLVCKSNENNKINYDFDRNKMYLDELKYFLECISYNKNSSNDSYFASETLKYALYMRNNAGVVK